MTNRENSVMVALGELARIEQGRVEDEQRAVAARRRAEEARVEEARAARDRAAREAELERVRVAAEADAKVRVGLELQRDRSLDELRLHLAAVQAEREAMRDALRARIEGSDVGRASRRGPWALAFGLSSLVAAALAGGLVLQQQSIEVVHADTASADVAALRVAPVEVPREDPVLAVAEPTTEAMAPAPAEAPPRVRTRGTRQRDRERVGGERETDLSRELGLEHDEGDEVLSERFLEDATRRR